MLQLKCQKSHLKNLYFIRTKEEQKEETVLTGELTAIKPPPYFDNLITVFKGLSNLTVASQLVFFRSKKKN